MTSESVKGKIDVRSEEGTGTEIKVTFFAEKPDAVENPLQDIFFIKDDEPFSRPTVSLVGFDTPAGHRGVELLRHLLLTYLKSWWNFKIVNPECGDIMIINEDMTPVKIATEEHNTQHPFIIMSASRGNPALMAIASDHERIGGFCRILYKPGGPYRLLSTLKLAVHATKIGSMSRCTSGDGKMANGILHSTSMSIMTDKNGGTSNSGGLFRRKSEDYKHRPRPLTTRRPSITPRTSTAFIASTWNRASSYIERGLSHEQVPSTISVGTGGTLLRTSISNPEKLQRQYRVLVVEDNNILRNLL